MKLQFLSRFTFIGFILGGISYWLLPYNEMYLMGIHVWAVMAIGSFLASFITASLVNGSRSKIALSISGGVVLAVIGRIFFDLLVVDSTSHNLAVFEIIVAVLLTLPNTFLGSYFSSLIFKTPKA